MSIKNKYVSLDTEFSGTNEKYLHPVCAVLRFDGESHKFWTLEQEEVERFKELFNQLIEDGCIIISFLVSAETRFLTSIGYSDQYLIDKVSWFDPYILWRMLRTVHPSYRWGNTFLKDGTPIFSTPPPGYFPRSEWGEDEETGDPRYSESISHKETAKILS